MTEPCKFEKPTTLKQCLQFLARLSESDVSSQVIAQLRSRLDPYCKSTYLTNFENSGSLFHTINNADTIFKKILPPSFSSTNDITYGTYADLDNCESNHTDCVKDYSDAIISKLPQVYAALSLLYFNVSHGTGIDGAGQWSLHSSNQHGQDTLFKWLRDKCPSPNSVGSSQPDLDSAGILTRGFQASDNIESSSTNEIAITLKGSQDISCIGHIQSALAPMLFLVPWCHSMTAHASLFLKEFCERVHGDNTNLEHVFGKAYPDGKTKFVVLKLECQNLKASLDPLVNGSKGLYAVCEKSNDLYKNLWDDSKIKGYVDWLTDNKIIDKLKESLEQMKNDSGKWDKGNLKDASSAGPFKYGFAPTTAWSGMASYFESTLKPCITRLTAQGSTGTLDSLKNAFQTPAPSKPTVTPSCSVSNVADPKTLKDCLQLLAKLNELKNLKESVKKEIKNRLGQYCINRENVSSDYLYNFDGDDGYFYSMLKHSKFLIDRMLSSTEHMFGAYSNLVDSCQYAPKVVDAIESCIPKVFGALYFLYYQVSLECRSIKGGGWSGTQLKTSSKPLCQWLSNSNFRSHFLPGGFKVDDLRSSTTGSSVAEKVKTLLSYDKIGYIQYALAGMLFLCRWHPSLTAHALLFVDKFCSILTGSDRLEFMLKEFEFQTSFNVIKLVCKKLKRYLQPFVNSTSSRLHAVCQKNTTLYSSVWDPKYLRNYVQWLQNNLCNIKQSLQNMLRDSYRWTESSIQTTTATGPFSYGFVFANGWDGTPLGTILQSRINDLTTSITDLLKCLRKSSEVDWEDGDEVSYGGMCTGSFIQPTSFKEHLCLFAALGALEPSNNLMKNVLQKQAERIQLYCGKKYLSNCGISSGLFRSTYQYANSVLEKIVMDVDYGPYNYLEDFVHESCACVQNIVKSLYAGTFFEFVVAMHFLYFHVSQHCENIGGGQWKTYRFNDSGTNLHKFLTDDDNMPAAKLLKRGFSSNELSISNGQNLAAFLKQIISHTDPGYLQKSLVPMLFTSPSWYDVLTGYGILFLHMFCQEIIEAGKTFQQIDTESFATLKAICQNLKNNVEPFVDGTLGLSAVCKNNRSLYKELWQSDMFESYVSWLVHNLDEFMASLHSMSIQSIGWTTEKLTTGQSAGPSAYGFVFADSNWKSSNIQEKLRNAIQKLTSTEDPITPSNGSIMSLLDCLCKLLQPATLKDYLQLFGKLNIFDTLKKDVLERLRERFKDYCGHDCIYQKSFADEKAYLSNTFKSISQFSTLVCSTSESYGKYSWLPATEEVADNCAEAIIKYLAQVYPPIYLLYFQVSDKCKDIGGNLWKDQQLKQSNHAIHKWLIGTAYSHSGFFFGGFSESDISKSSVSASDIARILERIVHHESPGALQKALLNMMLHCEWSDSLTGHALTFLWEFCSSVEAGTMNSVFLMKYPAGNLELFASVCKHLKQNLEGFVGTKAIISAVCENNTALFFKHWHGDAFPHYVDWLRITLPRLNGSLAKMSTDSRRWDKEKLQCAESAGPFKYGFVFNKTWKISYLKSALQSHISKVTGSVSALAYFLNPAFNASIPGVLDAAEWGYSLGFTVLKTLIEGLKVKPKESGQNNDREQQNGKGETDTRESETDSDDNGVAPSPQPEPPAQSDSQLQTGTSSHTSNEQEATPGSSCNLTEPTSLVGCLQFMAQLSKSKSLRSHVIETLQSGMEPYINNDYLISVGNEDGYLPNVFEKAEKLLTAILGGSDIVNKYGMYSQMCNSAHDDCVEDYCGSIVKTLPKVFGALYFLYFNTSDDCNGIGGGGWKSYELRDGQNLQKWLTNTEPTEPLIRGFSYAELSNSSSGAGIAGPLKEVLGYAHAGTFQKALTGMLFICPWNNGLTGHACLFVKAFCDKVQIDDFKSHFQEKFSTENFSDLKEVCSTVSIDLGAFIKEADDYSGDSSILRAVCQSNGDLFDDIWDDTNVEEYIDWLKQNLQNIIIGLQRMSEDSKNWDTQRIQAGTSGGPFRFGFVFGKSWEKSYQPTLESIIGNLIGSDFKSSHLDVTENSGDLQKLVKVLQSLTYNNTDDYSAPTAIIAAVGGTVVGAAGLGAAYAYNIWGFATLVQSFLASLL